MVNLVTWLHRYGVGLRYPCRCSGYVAREGRRADGFPVGRPDEGLSEDCVIELADVAATEHANVSIELAQVFDCTARSRSAFD